MKKLIVRVMIALVAIAALLPIRAFAGEDLKFQLSVDGTGAVTLVSSKAGGDGVSSIQFSLSVSSGNVADAGFEFSDEVTGVAKVCDFRYHKETRTLNVYISGTNALFGTDKTQLAVGKAVAYDSNSQAATATFRAMQETVGYVYGEELKKPTPTPTPMPTPGSSIPWNPGPVSPSDPTLTPTPTVTATPTPTSTPTPTPTGPRMYSGIKLYYGDGDVTGQYASERYAVVWNKDGYTVEFKSVNPKIATVGKRKGLVTAVSVGKTTVKATFTDKETGEKIVRSCRITVKRNAVDAGISPNSENKLLNLTVGDSFQTKAYRTDSDGVQSWSGRDKITDGVRFLSSNPEVFTVGKTKGKVTAVGAGEAELTVWAVQSECAEYGEDGKVVEYRATTKPRKYKVVVKEAE